MNRHLHRGPGPVAALVLAAALWGVATSGTKFALGGFDPLTLLAVELASASAALWTGLWIRGYRPAPSWRLVVPLAVLEPALAYGCETLGLNRTSAANGSVIAGLESSFVVVLAAVFLRERITRPLCGALGAGLLGLVALEHVSWLSGPSLGDGLMLCGVLSAAAYTIVARGITEDCDSLSLTAHQFALATVIVVPLAATSWLTGSEAVPVHVAPKFWIVAALVGILGFGGSFLLYNHAIAFVEATAAAVIINLIPAFGLISAVAWLGERLTIERCLGGVLITASVAVFIRTELRTRAAPSALTSAALTDPRIIVAPIGAKEEPLCISP